MQKFRTSKDRKEIFKVLKKKLEESAVFSIWQKDKEEKRTFLASLPLHTCSIEEANFSVILDRELSITFDSDLDTYFLIDGQDFVFRTTVSIDQSSDLYIVNFSLPREVRMAELRNHPRTTFSLEEKKIAEASFPNKSSKLDNIVSTCPIINISAGGVCLLITKETLCQIDFDQIVEIKGLDFFLKGIKKARAKIRNARVYSSKKLNTDEMYALGLQFE